MNNTDGISFQEYIIDIEERERLIEDESVDKTKRYCLNVFKVLAYTTPVVMISTSITCFVTAPMTPNPSTFNTAGGLLALAAFCCAGILSCKTPSSSSIEID